MRVKMKKIICIASFCLFLLLSSFHKIEAEDDIVFTAYDVNIEMYSLFNVAIMKDIISIESIYKAGNYDNYEGYWGQVDPDKMTILLNIISDMKEATDKYDFSLDGHCSQNFSLAKHCLQITSKYKKENNELPYGYVYDGVKFLFKFHVDNVNLDSILDGNVIIEKMPHSQCKRIFDIEGICGKGDIYNNEGEFQEIRKIIMKAIKQGFGEEIWPWEKVENSKEYSYIDILDNTEINHLQGNKTKCDYEKCLIPLKEYLQQNTKWSGWEIDTNTFDNIFLERGMEKITIMKKIHPVKRIGEDYLWDTSILYQIQRIVSEIKNEITKINNNKKEFIIEKDGIVGMKDRYLLLENYIRALNNIIQKFEQDEDKNVKCDSFLFLSSQKAENIVNTPEKNKVINDYNTYRDDITVNLVELARQQREIQREINKIQREIDETQREIDWLRYEEKKRRDEQIYQEEREATKKSICIALFLGGFSILIGILSILISLESSNILATKEFLYQIKYYKLKRWLSQIIGCLIKELDLFK